MAATKTKVGSKTTTKKPDDLTRRLKAVIKQEAETWVEFAQVAEEIYRTEHWRQKGYDSPKEYVLKETEGKVSYEIFMHRVKMGQAIRQFKLKKNEIIALGWTKFKELAVLGLSTEGASREDMVDLIDDAKDKSFREVQEFVRKERIKRATGKEQKTVTINFRLLDEQDNVVKEALDTAMELCDTDNPSIGLVYICTEFLTNHSEDGKVVQAIKEKVMELSEPEQKAPHKPHANKGKAKKKAATKKKATAKKATKKATAKKKTAPKTDPKDEAIDEILNEEPLEEEEDLFPDDMFDGVEE